ncbi:formylmethanofuran dehydrogenase subunit C [Methylobrevis albus]|uniref:Formylmethanofuran dehydrogenase subunit C n=1 Tax=Methylobrevis albus TaxID=2793297 RepID=A0A931I4B0_9HYPH|nr:formylmethanofuran dehydrogenase subunit C [Methylobrevis albus]MBH0239637.1 formylmethanofuran dehydrogenase subunit C [Methylobrevis albus]
MGALTFTLRGAVPERLDLSPLTPEALAGKSVAEIEAITVGTTRLAPTVGDLFTVSGDDAATIRFEGGSERFDRIGRALKSGSIHVEGDVGARLGEAMAGGEITVSGSAHGPYAAAALAGGRITIEGDAGDCVGAALPAAMAGMTGGIVLIGGTSGAATGDRMRRGTIAVLGGTGSEAGARMIGGTILTKSFGANAGLMMKRGTLIATSGKAPSATFVDSGHYDLAFLGLLGRWLVDELPRAADLLPSRVRRFRGDMAMLGKGELMLGG